MRLEASALGLMLHSVSEGPAMRVLVTGHQGYIGTVLVPVLQAAGHSVVGVDTGYFRECLFGSPPEEIPGINADVRDIGPRDCMEFDAVIHLAGLSNDPLGHQYSELTNQINLRGTIRVAKAAKSAGVRRFLFASSCSLYGASGDTGAWVDEDCELTPLTPYGQAKGQAERALSKFCDEKFCTVFLRNATAYGVSSRLRTDLVVNDLVAQAVRTGEIVLNSDGSAWRPIVHVRDICKAFTLLLEAPADVVSGRAYNVGCNAENYRIEDIAKVIVSRIPGTSLRLTPDNVDRRSYRVRFDRLSAEVADWQPDWNLSRGVDELAGAYRSHGVNSPALTGSTYQRLAQIEFLQRTGWVNEQLRVRTQQPGG